MKSVIGIDPGGRSTGIVLVVGGKLADFAVIERKGKEPLPDADYLASVRDRIFECELQAKPLGAPVLLSVEGLTKPTGFRKGGGKGLLNPLDLAGPAMVLGMVLACWGRAVVVDPHGNGSKPFFAYPEEIRPKPGGKGSDKLRHARSAWDVAISGVSLEVLRTAQARSTIST